MIYFATSDPAQAWDYIQKAYPGRQVDRASCAALLELVKADVVRIQDPLMHAQVGVMPGQNWSDNRRDECLAACEAIKAI